MACAAFAMLTRMAKPARNKVTRTKRPIKLALWSLVVTLLILALMMLPYVERWAY